MQIFTDFLSRFNPTDYERHAPNIHAHSQQLSRNLGDEPRDLSQWNAQEGVVTASQRTRMPSQRRHDEARVVVRIWEFPRPRGVQEFWPCLDWGTERRCQEAVARDCCA